MFYIGVYDTKVARTRKATRVASFNRVMLFLLSSSCVSLLVFGTRKWPEQARLQERIASIGSCFFYGVFLFSIDVWDTKVAKTGKAARAASFNRVMLFVM